MGLEKEKRPYRLVNEQKKEVSDDSETSCGGSRGSRTPDPLLVRQML